MRTSPVTVLALVALTAAAGCSSVTPEEIPERAVEAPEQAVEETADDGSVGDGPGGQEDGQEEIVEWVFGTGEQITVELTMYSTEDGGRSTLFFSGYRPTVEFDYLGQSVDCSVQLPAELDGFYPGETHLVGLECVEAVTVHVDEQGFVLIESGKENGEGEVIFTEV